VSGSLSEFDLFLSVFWGFCKAIFIYKTVFQEALGYSFYGLDGNKVVLSLVIGSYGRHLHIGLFNKAICNRMLRFQV
jgi:hypothetical protein